MFDPNGIFVSKENDEKDRKIFKKIRGMLFEKYYEIIDKEEEYKIRSTSAKQKLIISYMVNHRKMFDGIIQVLPLGIDIYHDYTTETSRDG